MADFEYGKHVVIIGWDEFSRLITRRLCRSDKPVSIITEQQANIPQIREEFENDDVEVIQRELTSYKTFSEVGIDNCLRIFVNRKSDDDSLIAILNMKKVYSKFDLDFVAVLQNDELEDTFQRAGVTYAVSKYVIASKIVTSYMYESDVAEFASDILAGTDKEGDHDLQQYLVTGDNGFVGEDYIELFWEIKNKFNCVPVGVSQRQDHDSRELIKDPPDDLTLKAGDYILIIVDQASESELQDLFGVEEGLNE